jgi:hypothetical protein
MVKVFSTLKITEKSIYMLKAMELYTISKLILLNDNYKNK